MLHVQVSEAAVIAMPHAKWVERPLLVVKPHMDANISKQEVLTTIQVLMSVVAVYTSTGMTMCIWFQVNNKAEFSAKHVYIIHTCCCL